MVRRLKKSTIIALLVLLSFFMLSCKTNMEKYGAFVSEIRDNLYEGENGAFTVSAITGEREEPYIFDGHAGGNQEFTVITVRPLEYNSDKKYTYKVKIGEVEYSGDLTAHPFGKTYSCDITAKSTEQTLELKITESGKTHTVNLTSVKADDMITAEKALDIAVEKLKKQLDSIKTGGALNAEIYIRFMENPIDTTGGYFWYVAIISDTQLVYAALINAQTMEVTAIRN